MLGWEFPPFISGGLGTACHGLTRAMTRLGTEILFVLPKAVETEGAVSATGRRAAAPARAAGMTLMAVPSRITSPYASAGHVWPGRTAADPERRGGMLAGDAVLCVLGVGAAGGYEGDLIGRIQDYANRCLGMTEGEPFDVIHAHDWVTYPAGMAIAARTGKPLVVHVHSTEFDRSGDAVNQPVYDIERAGMKAASAVIAVSHLTKRVIVERYGIAPEKVRVVHNGVQPREGPVPVRSDRGEKTVLFLGRITMQKGPGFFVSAAARVLEKQNNVRFLMAGWGDLGPQVVERVAAMGISRWFRFAGFLRGAEVEQAYRAADVYVMPSVSEPFGLTALEAVQWGVPVILSKNSGVAEVLPQGALKVDFWDVNGMADRILALLRRPALAEALCRNASAAARLLTWDEAAKKCLGVYHEQVASGYN
jgi:glycosyltransferase involved in cell wall biosynthesis